jgi:hypothetical protein
MDRGARRANVLVGALFILIGIGLLVAAIRSGATRREFVREADSADGVVVGLNAGGSHPQIEFTTSSGQKISYPQGGFIFGYRPGDRVRVLYRPGDPAKTACVDAPGALWFTPLFLGSLGILCVMGGILSARGRGA